MLKTLAVILVCLSIAPATAAQSARAEQALAQAFDQMSSGDWSGALTTAGEAGPVARDIIEWHRLRAGRGDFDTAVRFLERRPDWPGLPYLMRRSERHLPFGVNADSVIAFFAPQPPQTGHGAIALIAAYRAKGMSEEAEALAVEAWVTHRFSPVDEALLLTMYGDLLRPHHTRRMDMLLWRAAASDVDRMMPRVSAGWQKLAVARLALRSNKNGVDALVEAVPKDLQAHPGLMFERMQWRAKKGRNAGAVEIFLEQDTNNLGEPERWAGWRRSLARAEMRAGRSNNAYRLASEHGMERGSHFADLEWLAGYLALTYQKDAAKALTHFLRFRGAVETPISLGRAGYWEGRAHEAMGDADTARLSYLFGAEFQTSFYGLLAAQKAGVPMDPALAAKVPSSDLENASFASSSVFEAGRMLLAAGELSVAERFLTHLTESLAQDDVARLGAWAIERDEPHLAVMIGKRAASQGIVVPFTYYPLANLGVIESPVPDELALAIARRESEFDHNVTSHAGAIGLMQVMPATAQSVADDLNLRYSRARLVNDRSFNARIGAAYLDEMMALFDGNPVMVAAAYNAGPGRPIRWMRSNGNPLRGGTDIVDWIEHIPFDETRNYVMRVTESLPVYRARLTGVVEPIAFTAELTGTPGHVRQAKKGEYIRPKARAAVAVAEMVVDDDAQQHVETTSDTTRPKARPARTLN